MKERDIRGFKMCCAIHSMQRTVQGMYHRKHAFPLAMPSVELRGDISVLMEMDTAFHLAQISN